jgi:NAD(P)H dehydrogenase (quinone)
MFVVLGASGRTGKVVAETLLARKKAVRVVLHEVAKERAWKDSGADVAVADVEDQRALGRAFKGAEGAYVLLPPALTSSQFRADNDRRAKNIAAAIQAAGVGHVVLLSSVGAQHRDGTGTATSLYDAEATIGASLTATGGTRAVTFLRAAYFLENWALGLPGLGQGFLPTFLLADRAVPMVATADVGRAAARLLAEGGSGKRVVNVAGPREYSPTDVAAALSKVVGKPIAARQFPVETMAAVMVAAGMGGELSRLFQELTHGLNMGRVAWEEGHPIWRGETGVEAVLSSLVASAK